MRKQTVAVMLIFSVFSAVILLRGASASRWIPVVILAIGILGGRWFCGHLCPVGWLQRLFQRLPLQNRAFPSNIDRALRWGKYAVAAAMPFMMMHRSITLALVLAGIVGMVLLLSLISSRPFCKYLCPVGALYGLLNHVSIYQIDFDAARCIHCHACERVCPMEIDPAISYDKAECIRCGACRQRCPKKAIH